MFWKCALWYISDAHCFITTYHLSTPYHFVSGNSECLYAERELKPRLFFLSAQCKKIRVRWSDKVWNWPMTQYLVRQSCYLSLASSIHLLHPPCHFSNSCLTPSSSLLHPSHLVVWWFLLGCTPYCGLTSPLAEVKRALLLSTCMHAHVSSHSVCVCVSLCLISLLLCSHVKKQWFSTCRQFLKIAPDQRQNCIC